MQYTLVGNESGQNITVFVPGEEPKLAHSSHPNFEQIVEGVLAGDESVLDLFDLAVSAGTKFKRITERVSSAYGRLYLDGVEIDNTLAKQVVRFISEGVEEKQWMALVKFFENVQSNPNEHSREMLYDWLNAEDFTITEDGMIVGYKSVLSTDDEGSYRSTYEGYAIVDGEVTSGYVKNKAGSVVEMPRNMVTFAPDMACSNGLHVGTYSYAESYTGDVMLEVHVNPRDVVSVPTDSDAQKMRVCRYTVVDTIDKPYPVPVLQSWDDEDMDDEDCFDCGERYEDCICGLSAQDVADIYEHKLYGLRQQPAGPVYGMDAVLAADPNRPGRDEELPEDEPLEIVVTPEWNADAEAARLTVERYGNIDKAAGVLGKPRDPFRAFCRKLGITGAKK